MAERMAFWLRELILLTMIAGLFVGGVTLANGMRDARDQIGQTGSPLPGAAVFPDGTWLPALNGVREAPQFPGFPDQSADYAPVVRIQADPATGVQWYVHADGTRSTTRLFETESEGVTSFEPDWAVVSPIAGQSKPQ